MISYINNTVHYLDNNEKPIRFAQAIFSRKDLNSTEKLILIEIFDLSTKRGYCSAKNGYFMKGFGLSEKTVSRTLTSLLDKEMITMENRGDGGVDRVTMINSNIVKMTRIHSQVVQSKNIVPVGGSNINGSNLSGEYIIEDKIITKVSDSLKSSSPDEERNSSNKVKLTYKNINKLKTIFKEIYPKDLRGFSDDKLLRSFWLVSQPRKNNDQWMSDNPWDNIRKFLVGYMEAKGDKYVTGKMYELNMELKDWRERGGTFNFTAPNNEQERI